MYRLLLLGLVAFLTFPVLAGLYMLISGKNLMGLDDKCTVLMDGLRSYVEQCSDTQVIAVVPWEAEAGLLVAESDGATSAGFSVNLSPLDVKPSEVVSGFLYVKVEDETDFLSLAASEGDPPSAITHLGGPEHPAMEGWYSITVEPGQEVAKAISYSRHEDVLFAGPEPVPVPADEPNDTHYPSQWALSKIGAPVAVRLTKELALRSKDMTLADGLRLYQEYNRIVHASEDIVEGTKAFEEKRAPQFKGR